MYNTPKWWDLFPDPMHARALVHQAISGGQSTSY